jgi:glutathione S-transferase
MTADHAASAKPTLYYSRNSNPRVAVAVARYLESPVALVLAHPRHPDHEAAFRSINPNGLVPVLVDGSQTLWEADAIACHLSAKADLDFWRRGAEMADMVMWLSWSAYHLNPAAGTLYFEHIVRPTFSSEKCPPAVIAQAMADFRTHATVLEQQLHKRTWLVGNAVSYADFRVATVLPFADRAGLPLAEFPQIRRWHDQLLQIAAWREPFAGLAL